MGKKKVTLSIDSKIYDNFRDYCEDNAVMLSKKIELFMKEVLKGKRKMFLLQFVLLFLINFASAATIFFDNFEDGNVNDWDRTSGAGMWHANNTGPIDPPIDSWHMISSNSAGGTRFAQKNISTAGNQNIIFSFYYKTDTNLLDPGEYYTAEWFDGSVWNVVLNLTGSLTTYTLSKTVLGIGANNNANFKIRFSCTSNLDAEGCALDNVTIVGDVIGGGDTTHPSVFLKSPLNGTTTTSSIVFFKADFSDNVNVSNATLYIWNSTNNLIGTNFTKLGNASISANLSFNLGYVGTFFWNYLAVDNSSNQAFNNTNFTFIYSAQDNVAPQIIINSPANATLNTSTPRLNITIIEQNVSAVWISIDGGSNITYANNRNGTIDFAYLNLIFADDFNKYPEGSDGYPIWIVQPWFRNASVFNKTYKLYNETPLDDALAFINSSYFSALDYGGSAKVMVPQGYNGSAYLTPRFAGVEWKYEIALDYQFSSININKAVNNVWSQLGARWTGDFGIFVNRGEWHTLGFDVRGNNISALVDNILMLNLNDSSLNNATFTGFSLISLDDVNSHLAYFDDLELHKKLNYGSHTLRVYANDSSGNINSTSISFFVSVDTTPPTIYLISPTNGTTVTTNLTFFAANFSDDVNLKNATLYVWNVSRVLIGTNFSAISGTANVTNLSFVLPREGNYTWNYLAYDNSSNSAMNNTNFSLSFYLPDTTPPGIFALIPLAGIQFNVSNIIEIAANVTDNVAVSKVFVNITLPNNTIIQLILNNVIGNKYNNIYTVPNLEGRYNITFIANDTANNINATEKTYFIANIPDTTPPNISIVYPQNTTYTTNVTRLNYTVSSDAQACWYSLNRGIINISITCGNNATGLTSNEGSNTWSIWANDSANNINSSSVTFFKDTIFPNIEIVYPVNGTTTNNAQINVNYTVSDNVDLSWCGWSNNNGATNTTITCGANITGQVWNEGSNTIIVYVNDTANNRNYSSVTFNVDTIAPLVSIVYPQNISYNTNISTLNYTVSDANLQSCWYSLNRGIINISITCGNNATGLTSNEGSNTWSIWANDSAGNVNLSTVTFTKDTVAPLVTIISPQNTIYANSTIQFNVSLNENGDICKFSLDNWDNNYTMTQYNVTYFNYTNTSIADGSYLAKFWCNDSTGNVNNSAQVGFGIDTTSPHVTIISPQNITYNSLPIPFNFSLNEAGSCMYSLNNGLTNYTMTANASSTGFNATNTSISDGSYTTSAYCNDTAGNKNYTSSVVFSVDRTAPNLIIYSPLNQSYNNATILVNISATDLNLGKIWFFNGTTNETYSVEIYRTFAEGSNTLIVYANDTFGNVNFTNVVFYVNTTISSQNGTKPIVNISYPSYASTYGNNNSIELNFSVAGNNLDKCWLNINNSSWSEAKNIPDCINTTFSVPTDGEYNFSVYVNESIQGLNGSDSLTFFVKNEKPTVHLLNPVQNKYLNYSVVNFSYVPSSGEFFDSCKLWSNVTGIYEVNQTDNNISLGKENSFVVSNINEGKYIWAIECATTSGNKSVTGNRTLTIDVTQPNLTIIEGPLSNNSYTAPVNISVSLNVSDSSPLICYYNLTLASGSFVEFNLINNCTRTVISISVPNIYNITFGARDAAGNIQTSSTTFAVFSSGEGGGRPSSGGGGGGIGIPLPGAAGLKIGDLNNIFVERGTRRDFGVQVENTGGKFLNSCRLVFKGKVGSWFKNSETKSLGLGEKFNFIASLEVPGDAEPGIYDSEAFVVCDEIEKSTKINVEVYRNIFEAEILDYERVGNNLKVKYSLREYGGVSHDIKIKYYLLDFSGLTRYSGEESVLLNAGEKIEKVIQFDLPKDSFGEFKFKADFDDGKTKISATKDIFLSKSTGLTGLAISDANKKALGWLGIILISGVILFFVFKFAKKHYLRRKYNRKFYQLFVNIHKSPS